MPQSPEHFDAIVIGSGQGGNPLVSAMAKHGWKVALVERRYIGGTCVNDGCTPTKTVAASARVAYLAKRGADFGVHTGPIRIDLTEVYARKQSLLLASREKNQIAMEKACTVVFGEATFAESQPGGGVHAIDVRTEDDTRRLEAPRVFLDTGERPSIPEIPGLADVPYLTSTSILDLQTVPEHLVILGAGTIALEFAQMYIRFGSKVTVLERGERIAPHEDDDIAACLRDILTEDGIEILTCTSIETIHSGGADTSTSIEVNVTTDDGRVSLTASHLLVAAGRKPNVEPLRLERVGVAQDRHGYVQVNGRLETSVAGIWAIGDVKGAPAFTHIAYDDFRILRANLLENGSRTTDGRWTNYVTFTDPELARIGINETEAKQRGIDVRVATVPMKYMARANEMAEPRGMLKALVDPKTDQILGCTFVGVDAGELAATVEVAMMGKLPYTALRDAVFSHPTKAEVLNILFGSFADGKS